MNDDLHLDGKLEAFFRQYPVIGYPKGQTIVFAHKENTYFYYIETGAVKMSKVTTSGRQLVFHVFFPGAFFSLLSLIQEDQNEFDFTTVIPTTVRKIPKEELIHFFKKNPEELYQLQLRLLKGLRGLLNRIEQISLSSALQQVESLIHYFGKHFKSNENSEKISVKVTHQEIADWLGLSRENVSIQMKQLEEQGSIKMEDHYIHILKKM